FVAGVAAQTDFRVEVGEEEYVLGPAAAPMDSPLFSLQSPAGLLVFSGGGGNTLVYAQSALQPLSATPLIALKAGSRGTFDECGAWLLSSAANGARNTRSKNSPRFVGWYHAEEKGDYANGVTLKSMAYVESSDGISWKKPEYPNNRIITAAAEAANDPQRNNVGDGHVIQAGDYLYLFYWATDNWGVHLARSRVTDNGEPG